MNADYESTTVVATRKKFPDELSGTKRWNIRVNTRLKVIATRRRRILGISDFLAIFFSPAGADGARLPRQWIRQRRIPWKSRRGRYRHALFFHLTLVHSTVCTCIHCKWCLFCTAFRWSLLWKQFYDWIIILRGTFMSIFKMKCIRTKLIIISLYNINICTIEEVVSNVAFQNW